MQILKELGRALAIVVLLCGVARADDTVVLDLRVNDLVFDRTRGVLYASVPGNAPENANSVITIDPATGSVQNGIFVGSEPARLALASDDSCLYVGLDGAAAVRRLDLRTGQLSSSFSLGSGPFGLCLASDIAVVPGRTSEIVVCRYTPGISGTEGVAYFRNGVRIGKVTSPYIGGNVLEFGQKASDLFGFNNLTSDFSLYRLTLSKRGVKAKFLENVSTANYGVDVRFDHGALFVSSGQVVDPVRRQLLGTFPLEDYAGFGPGAVAPEPNRALVYFLRGDWYFEAPQTWTLIAGDRTSFTIKDTRLIPNVKGGVGGFLRWGPDGVAFFTTGGQVFLVRSELIGP